MSTVGRTFTNLQTFLNHPRHLQGLNDMQPAQQEAKFMNTASGPAIMLVVPSAAAKSPEEKEVPKGPVYPLSGCSEAATFEDSYGHITDVSIESYWKYEFTLRVTTSNGNQILMITGGDTNTIYKYDPTSCSWDEALYAGIRHMEVRDKEGNLLAKG